MKIQHILPVVALTLGTAAMVSSCADDNDSNPVLHMPETFTLNTPALASNALDLQNLNDSITLTWSQPDYGGMPLVTTYKLQYVVEGDGSEVTTDENGNLKFSETADVKEYDETTTSCSYKLSPSDVDLILLRELELTQADLPLTASIYYRVAAHTASTANVYSNVVEMHYMPYYQRLSTAEPVTWYLTGSCFGDLLTGMVPLYLTGDSYNEDTGFGTVSWTGYLPAGTGFKLRGSLTDNWATQIGQGGSFGEFSINDGGSGNISPEESGVYNITLDTKKVAMGDATGISITKTDDAPVYDGFYLNGSFNGWGDAVALTPVNTAAGMENHDWYTHISLDAGTEVKFQTNSWAVEIGSKYNETPSCTSGFYGVGAKSGGWNIYIKDAGNYLVIVNDITGAFRFIKE